MSINARKQVHSFALTGSPAACIKTRMDADQIAVRRFIRQMCDQAGLTPTELAVKAGLSHSTVTRFLNKPAIKHNISMRTLIKLSHASGVAVPVDLFPSGSEAARDLIQDSQELRWIEIWRRMLPEQRTAAVSLLLTIVPDVE